MVSVFESGYARPDGGFAVGGEGIEMEEVSLGEEGEVRVWIGSGMCLVWTLG